MTFPRDSFVSTAVLPAGAAGRQLWDPTRRVCLDCVRFEYCNTWKRAGAVLALRVSTRALSQVERNVGRKKSAWPTTIRFSLGPPLGSSNHHKSAFVRQHGTLRSSSQLATKDTPKSLPLSFALRFAQAPLFFVFTNTIVEARVHAHCHGCSVSRLVAHAFIFPQISRQEQTAQACGVVSR